MDVFPMEACSHSAKEGKCPFAVKQIQEVISLKESKESSTLPPPLESFQSTLQSFFVVVVVVDKKGQARGQGLYLREVQLREEEAHHSNNNSES